MKLDDSHGSIANAGLSGETARPGTVADAEASIEMREQKKMSMAEVATTASLSNAAVVMGFSTETFGEIPWLDAAKCLQQKVEALRRGSLEEADAILMAQAVALNSMFVGLSHRAAHHMGKHFDLAERLLRLALRAQNQARTTLEALAARGNPGVVIARQANFASGHQQVNNGMPTGDSPVGTESGQNKLSGDGRELYQDSGASATAGRTDPEMGALAEIDRAEDHRWEGQGGPQRLEGRGA